MEVEEINKLWKGRVGGQGEVGEDYVNWLLN